MFLRHREFYYYQPPLNTTVSSSLRLIASFPGILKSYPVLRRRAAYQGLLFCVFNLFWTSIAVLLIGSFFNYTQETVAWFAFVGATGALTAPIAGRVADKGYTKIATGMSFITYTGFIIAVGTFLYFLTQCKQKKQRPFV